MGVRIISTGEVITAEGDSQALGDPKALFTRIGPGGEIRSKSPIAIAKTAIVEGAKTINKEVFERPAAAARAAVRASVRAPGQPGSDVIDEFVKGSVNPEIVPTFTESLTEGAMQLQSDREAHEINTNGPREINQTLNTLKNAPLITAATLAGEVLDTVTNPAELGLLWATSAWVKFKGGLNKVNKSLGQDFKSFVKGRKIAKAEKGLSKLKLAKKVDDISDGISKSKKVLQAETERLFDATGFGDVKVPVNLFDDLVRDMPSDGITAIQKAAGTGKKLQVGKLTKDFVKGRFVDDPIDVNDLKQMKTALNKVIPNSVWSGKVDPTNTQRLIMQKSRDIKTMIAQAARNPAEKQALTALNDKWSNFFGTTKGIQRQLHNVDGSVNTKLLTTLNQSGSEGSKRLFLNFQKDFYPEMAGILSDINKINRNRAIKKWAAITGGVSFASEIARRAIIKPAVGAIVPSGPSEGGVP